MRTSQLLEQLIEALRCLPGVGPKSAQRMAFYVLQRNRQGGLHLSKALENAMMDIGHCQKCRTFPSKGNITTSDSLYDITNCQTRTSPLLPITIRISIRYDIGNPQQDCIVPLKGLDRRLPGAGIRADA